MADEAPSPPYPPPPYAAVQQPQMPLHVHGPGRVYVTNRRALLHHVHLRHPEVSREELDREVETRRRWWARSIAPLQLFGVIYPPYANDFEDFFLDCQMWHKYICVDDSGCTSEELSRRLVAFENENRYLSRRIERMHKEIEGHEQALAEKNAIATAYNDVIKGLKEEVKQAEIAREVTEQTMTSRVSALEAELRQAKKESAARLEAEIAHQQALATELKKFKDNSAAEKAKLSNKITNLKAQNDSLQEQVEQLLNKKVKEQGQGTTPIFKFASIDETLAKVEAQSTQVHKIKDKEMEEEIHDESKAAAEKSSASDKMTYAELELECRRLSDLVARRNLETGQLHVKTQNLARRTREVEKKERELEAKEEGMKKGLAAILTKAKHVGRVGKVVCKLVKEGSVPASSDLLAEMLADLKGVVRKFEEDVGGQGSNAGAGSGGQPLEDAYNA